MLEPLPPEKHFALASLMPLAGTMTSLDNELIILKLTASDKKRAIFLWDVQDHHFTWSENFSQAFPFLKDKPHTTESQWISLIHPDDRTAFVELCATLKKGAGSFMLEYRLAPGNGHVYYVKHLGVVKNEGGRDPQHVLGLIEYRTETQPTPVITPLLNQSTRYKNHSTYPELFLEKLDATIIKAEKHSTSGVLLIISLGNLAMIINSYGHHNSEAIISSLINSIRMYAGENNHADRISRDQIGVIFPECDKESAEAHAHHIHQLIQTYGTTAPMGLLHVTSTLVSVDFPATAKNAIDALDKAYIALSNASTSVYRTFNDVKHELIQSRQHMGLANYLRRAIQDQRLQMAYQPVIESKTGNIAHYEALLRVVSDEGQISSAGPLIPIAERMGLIEIVDTQVMEMVVKDLIAAPDVSIAFNISNLTTENPKWLARFHALLTMHPDIAGRLIVEITETAAQRDLRQASFFVSSLQAAGVQVALDDFGSGYTSFRQLKALSVDMVKIDGAFVKDLVDNVDSRFFVKTLLEFTKGFGLKAVAEFVENGEIAKLLMELGVEYMQGYYFGKPENTKPWLK